MDIVPTLLGVAGIPFAPSLFDGNDLFARQEGRLVYSLWQHEHAVQDARWKLLLADLDDPGRARLFDIERDPAETRDLAADHAETTRRLLETLAKHAERQGGASNRIESSLERLRAIGYVQ